MTALPPEVSWEPPRAGRLPPFVPLRRVDRPAGDAAVRVVAAARPGGSACTPGSASELGQRAPLPHHVIVNGWYFYSLNWIAPGNMLRSLPSILWHVAREPRAAGGVIPATVRHSFPIMERRWRADLQPRYRAAVAAAEERVEGAPGPRAPGAHQRDGRAGRRVLRLGGGPGRRRLQDGDQPGEVLSQAPGADARRKPPAAPGGHRSALRAGAARGGVAGLVACTGTRRPGRPPARRQHGRARGRAGRPQRPRRSRRSPPRRAACGSSESMLADAQHLVSIREEQVREWTLPWPVMRRAVLRIGESLVARGLLETAGRCLLPLPRRGARRAGRRRAAQRRPNVPYRRAQREEQARLVPPMAVGKWNPMLKRFVDSYPAMFGAKPSDRAHRVGRAGVAGHRDRPVRVIRGPARVRPAAAGRGAGGAVHRTGLDAALHARRGRSDRRGERSRPRLNRCARVRHPGGRRHAATRQRASATACASRSTAAPATSNRHSRGSNGRRCPTSSPAWTSRTCSSTSSSAWAADRSH